MNQSTQKQFNDILRQQGIQVGIKPIEYMPNEKCRLDEVEQIGVLERPLGRLSWQCTYTTCYHHYYTRLD